MALAATKFATEEQRQELDARARKGETVVPGGKGGKSLVAQEHLAEGRMRGGQTRKEQLGRQGYKEMGRNGGQTRKEQLGIDGYRDLGRIGGLATFASQYGSSGSGPPARAPAPKAKPALASASDHCVAKQN